jgi:hypothetical protein
MKIFTVPVIAGSTITLRAADAPPGTSASLRDTERIGKLGWPRTNVEFVLDLPDKRYVKQLSKV